MKSERERESTKIIREYRISKITQLMGINQPRIYFLKFFFLESQQSYVQWEHRPNKVKNQTKLRNSQPCKYRYLSMLPAATDISLLSLCSTVEWHYNEGPLIETGKIHVFTIQAPWQQKFCILLLNVENSRQVDDPRAHSVIPKGC